MFNPGAPFDPAGDVMRNYRQNSADAEFVSLKHYDIRDLVPLMGHLAELRNMKTLVISDNLLTRLPEDMSSLASLETLDMSRNPVPSASTVIRGLFSLPKLKNLLITLPEDDEDQIVATLAHLKTLNGVSLDVEAHEHNDGGGLAMSPQGLLESTRRGTSMPIPRGYSAAAKAATGRDFLKYQPWSKEMIQPLLQFQQSVSRVSDKLSNPPEYNDLVELVDAHVRAKTRSEPDPIRAAHAQLLGKSLLMEYSLDELSRSIAKYGPDIAEAVHSLYQSHVQLIADASAIIVALQEDRDRKIEALQEDLAKELLAKERALIQGPSTTFKKQDLDFASSPVSRGIEEYTDAQMRLPDSTSADSRKSNADVMPLAELRALLQVFFDSKKKHDAANISARLPCETIEQHVYTFLYSRTGNDEDIKRRASMLFQSIRFHAKHELDIEVFALMLRNELDEEYWANFAYQRKVVSDAIQSVLATSGGGSRDRLTEDEAAHVVNTLVPQEQSSQREGLLRVVNRALVQSDDAALRYQISYIQLGQTILRFYVASYLNSLKSVSQAFHELDEEKNGVISVNRLKILLTRILPGITSARAQELISIADPFANDVITFSVVVKMFRTIAASRSDESRSEVPAKSAASYRSPPPRSVNNESAASLRR